MSSENNLTTIKKGKILFNSIRTIETSQNSLSNQSTNKTFQIPILNKNETKDSIISKQTQKTSQKPRFRKVFHIQKSLKHFKKSETPKVADTMSKIFFINKKTRRNIQTQTQNKNNNHLGNIKLLNPKNDIYLEDLKEKIQNTFINQNALDLRVLKLYHQLNLEQQHQIYFSPDSSRCSDEEEKKGIKKEGSDIETTYKIIIGFSKKFRCNCKKSSCLKNYCECKRNHERCDNKCECEKCKNFNKNN